MHKRHMATDGCFSMLGGESGVAVRFKQFESRLLCIHCTAQRLALVVKDSAEDVEEMAEFNEQLL